MGHRSNTVIIDQNRIYIDCSQWGALGIPNCLRSGPKAFVPSANLQGDDEDPSAGLYDSAYCEGFVCIDHDRKLVLFDSGQSEAGRDADTGYAMYGSSHKKCPGCLLAVFAGTINPHYERRIAFHT